MHVPVSRRLTPAALVAALLASMAVLSADSPPPQSSQNPSPMVETTRRHQRLTERPLAGAATSVDAGLASPVRVFVPDGVDLRGRPRLLVHFHGAHWIPEQASAALDPPRVVATVHLGGGSGTYDAAFSDPAALDSLLAAVDRELERIARAPVSLGDLALSGFSAGHGAVRAVLRDPEHFRRTDAVLLLDGLHTGYLPPGTVLHAGGRLDTSKLEPILKLARAAVAGDKRVLITHSEIFPGTFASTTETTDYLIRELGLRRSPVLAWGPVGMQQLAEVRCGGLAILGFAGNTAPDHVDHFHAMPELLDELEAMGRAAAPAGECGER